MTPDLDLGTPSRRFPDWRTLYDEQSVESMPWFNPDLDDDLAAALQSERLTSGRVLDIGTGPGTQAAELAKLGFQVTATDLSAAAIALAAPRSRDVIWIQDDILASKLGGSFDLIFDRGCFHVVEPASRPDYVRQLHRLIRPGGHVFIKCFSIAEPERAFGPWRFARHDIAEIFGALFTLKSVRETVYQGTLEPLPRALFVVMQPRVAGAAGQS